MRFIMAVELKPHSGESKAAKFRYRGREAR